MGQRDLWPDHRSLDTVTGVTSTDRARSAPVLPAADVDPPLPVRGALRQLLPVLWLPVAGAVVCAGAVLALDDDSTTSTATARVGLTSAVEWPYYDAARYRLSGYVDDALKAAVIADAGGSGVVTDIAVEIPETQAFVDVVVTATDAGVAATVADAVADRVVALDAEQLNTGLDREVAVANEELDAANRQVEELDGQIADLIEQEQAARAAEDFGQYDLLQDQRRELQIRRDQILYNQSPLLDQRSRALLAQARALPEAESLTAAVVSSEEESRRTLQLLVAALVGGTLGLLAAWGWASRLGRVRDADLAAKLLGCRVDDATTAAGTGGGATHGALVLQSLLAGRELIGVVGANGATRRAASMAGASTPYTDSIEGAEDFAENPALGEVVDLGDPLRDDEALLLVVHDLDGAVVVAERNRTRLGTVRRWIATMQSRGVPTVGVVLLDARD
jgi:hypothetical protein